MYEIIKFGWICLVGIFGLILMVAPKLGVKKEFIDDQSKLMKTRILGAIITVLSILLLFMMTY